MSFSEQKFEVFTVLSDISNTLSDDNLYDLIIATPSISFKNTQIQGSIPMEYKPLSKVSFQSADDFLPEIAYWN